MKIIKRLLWEPSGLLSELLTYFVTISTAISLAVSIITSLIIYYSPPVAGCFTTPVSLPGQQDQSASREYTAKRFAIYNPNFVSVKDPRILVVIYRESISEQFKILPDVGTRIFRHNHPGSGYTEVTFKVGNEDHGNILHQFMMSGFQIIADENAWQNVRVEAYLVIDGSPKTPIPIGADFYPTPNMLLPVLFLSGCCIVIAFLLTVAFSHMAKAGIKKWNEDNKAFLFKQAIERYLLATNGGTEKPPVTDASLNDLAIKISQQVEPNEKK